MIPLFIQLSSSFFLQYFVQGKVTCCQALKSLGIKVLHNQLCILLIAKHNQNFYWCFSFTWGGLFFLNNPILFYYNNFSPYIDNPVKFWCLCNFCFRNYIFVITDMKTRCNLVMRPRWQAILDFSVSQGTLKPY